MRSDKGKSHANVAIKHKMLERNGKDVLTVCGLVLPYQREETPLAHKKHVWLWRNCTCARCLEKIPKKMLKEYEVIKG